MAGDEPFANLLRALPGERPNICFAAPAGFAVERAHLESPVFDAPARIVFDALREVIAHLPRCKILAEDVAERRIEAVQRSPLFRFPDRVSAQVVELEKGCAGVLLLSRACRGHYDFGVNARRVQRCLAALSARLGA